MTTAIKACTPTSAQIAAAEAIVGATLLRHGLKATFSVRPYVDPEFGGDAVRLLQAYLRPEGLEGCYYEIATDVFRALREAGLAEPQLALAFDLIPE